MSPGSPFAEVPGASWMPAHYTNYGFRPTYILSYKAIVIHCTDGRERAKPVAEMWQRPDHKSSAHFVIGQAGELIQCVKLRFAAWHAHDANASSIGIEHCARTPGELDDNDPGLSPSDALYGTSAQLVAYLLKAAGLPVQRGKTIFGHAEIDKKTTHTKCPDGCGWDWPRYLAMVQARYDMIGQPPALV